VESAAWISERKDVLSTFFYLATALAYVRWTQVGKKAWYLGAVALCLLGFLSKPSLMTLPFALLLLDFWPLGRVDISSFKSATRSVAKLAWGKAPFFLMAGIFAVIAMKVQAAGGLSEVSTFLSFPERLAVTGLAYGSYLERTFWPSGLAPFYAHPETLSPMVVALCWALLIGISASAIFLVKRAPYLFFGWFWFVGLLFPASGILTISDNFAPDRYAYVAHVGLFVALVWGTADLLRRVKLPAVASRLAGATAILLLGVLCTKQVAHWQSDEALWTHAVEVTERNYFAHNKLAVELLKAGRTEEAVEQLEASVSAQPDFAFAHANLGRVLAKRGETAQAVHHFERAVAAKPDDLAMRRALLPLLQQVDRGDAMLPHLEAITRRDPGDPKAHYDLAGLLNAKGNTAGALAHYWSAAELTPASNYLVRGDLGAVLVKSGDFVAAIEPLEAAAAQVTNPHRCRALYLLGFARHKLGDQVAARRHLEAALKINPQLSQARVALKRISPAGPTPAAPQAYVIKTD